MRRVAAAMVLILIAAMAVEAAVIGLGRTTAPSSSEVGDGAAPGPGDGAGTSVERLRAASGRAMAALDEMQLRAADAAAARAAATLAAWIKGAREHALAGARPIAPDLRARLEGFFPPDLLDRVRFRVGWGEEERVEGQIFRALGTRAITLESVIVFRDERIASDPFIWAHELAHVRQYDQWGVDGFCARYVRTGQLVEEEAWDVASRYKMWALESERSAGAIN